jgi:hypothetical protein
VLVESATAVVSQLGKKNATDLQTIVNGVSKEAVAATDDSISGVIENIGDGIEVIADEVMKGLAVAGEAIEEHPELILE